MTEQKFTAYAVRIVRANDEQELKHVLAELHDEVMTMQKQIDAHYDLNLKLIVANSYRRLI